MLDIQAKSVILPVDLADLNGDTVNEAFKAVDKPENVHLVRVLPLSERSRINWGTIDGESRADYHLRDLQHRLQGTPAERAQLHVGFGDAASVVDEVATKVNADLVLLPANTGRSAIARILSGPASEAIARTTQLPVLVMPSD